MRLTACLLFFLTPALLAPAAQAAEPALSQEAAGLKADLGLSVNALVSAVPACTLRPGDGALVLETGCVDAICTADSVEEIIEDVGATCTAAEGLPGQLRCKAQDGISFFDARKAAHRAIPTLKAIYLGSEYPGRTASGLGIGVSLGCYLQELGTPDKVEIDRKGDRFEITEVRFSEPKVWVQAKGGVVNRLVVYGPESR